ncbi:MAG: PAS domain S-box protein [Polyangiaceae bacterium]|nr:PAS domain S-box protein [Polyangiaceae bacterium]
MPAPEQLDALRDFVETSSIGLHWVAADGTILWANPADYVPLGYSEKEYIGRNITEFHADATAVSDILRRLTSGERLHNYEARLRCKDGTTRRVLITSSVKFDESGEFVHTRCFTVDVSERCHEVTELQFEALNREVERLRVLASRKRGLLAAILQHSPHGIIVCDTEGKLTLQNEAAEKIWAGSATADTVAGWGKYRAFHPDGRPFEATDWSMARALSKREVVAADEIHILRFDDRPAVLLGSSAPIFDSEGKLEGALSVFADITEFKRQDAELRVSAERYATTLRSIGDAVIATDAGGHVTFMNPVGESLTKWTLADALGKPLHEVFRIVNEHTREVVESPVDKVIRAGKIVGLANHTILTARDGSEVAIDDSGAPIFGDDGALVGVVLVFRDVTEKRREEDRRQFIAGASAHLVSSLDYVATLTTVANLSVPTIADWCAIDMVAGEGRVERLAVAHADPGKVRFAKEVEQKYPPDPQSPYGVHEVIRTGKAQMMSEIPEALLIAAAVDDEHLRIIEELGLKSSMVVPLRCRGRILGAITFVAAESNRRFGPLDLSLAEEIAGIAALAVDNARLYREAQNANSAKDEFLATVSHELRTPLSAILGWAHLLNNNGLPEEKRQHALEVIERNARAQAQLIEDLLDVSRIISGKLRLETRAFDLATIISAAVDGVRPAAEAKNVRISLQVDDAARNAVGDPDRLQQVVWNLLSNAVKFTGKNDTVTIQLTREGSHAEIGVTDTGMGIEPQHLPHIFERFKQANATTTRSHGGLGLGLSIVKHLVELHGGTVTAASEGANRGSSFKVRLPLGGVSPSQTILHASSRHTWEAPRLEGLKVLVVDDEEDTRRLVVTVLEAHGAIVTSVGSAAHALREVEREPPDVLVSDVGMPEEDGYSLIRKVRVVMKERGRPLPAVALTAYARREDRTRALLAGFQSHVVKPFSPDELLIVVATLAGRTEESCPLG